MRLASAAFIRAVLTSTVVLVLGGQQATGQVASGTGPAVGWSAVVDRYLAGDYADSTALLDVVATTTSPADTSQFVATLHEAVVSTANTGHATHLEIRRLKAAALVPLEALLPLSARVAHDARFEPLEALLRHALFALRGLEKAPPSRRVDVSRFRQWVEIGYMQFLLNAGRLEDVERVASELRLPENSGDMQVQHDMLRGLVRERVARLVTGARATGHTYLGGGVAGGMTGPTGSAAYAGGASARTTRDVLARRYWASAARWYERVLDSRPDDPEARLHLARTWLDRDEPARALALLRPLSSESCASTLCSLALLFSGEANQRVGAIEEASQAYLRASRDPLTRQSALVALLHLSLRRNGEAVLPLALQLREGAPLAREAEPDAWGVYVGGRRPNVDVVLAPLRLEVQR